MDRRRTVRRRARRRGDCAPDVTRSSLARLSAVTFPSENLFPGYYVEGFNEAWAAIAGAWKTHQGRCPGDLDRWYVESHVADRRDVLLTDDRALRAMCDRLRDEHALPVHAESVSEFVTRRC